MGNKQPKNNNTPEPDEEKSPVDEEKISPKTLKRMAEWEKNKTIIESLTEKDRDYNKTLKLYTTTKKRGEQLLEHIKSDLIASGFEDGARYIDALIEFIELNTLEVYSTEEGKAVEQNINNLFNNLEPAVFFYININIMPILNDYFKILVDIENLKNNLNKNKRNMSKLIFKNDDLGSIFALTAKPKEDRTRAHKKLNDIMCRNAIRHELIGKYLSKKPTPSPDSDSDEEGEGESKKGYRKKGDGKQNKTRRLGRSRGPSRGRSRGSSRGPSRGRSRGRSRGTTRGRVRRR